MKATRRGRARDAVAAMVVVAMVASACAGTGANPKLGDAVGDDNSSTIAARPDSVPEVLIADGHVTDEALAAVYTGDELDPAVVKAVVEDFLALPEADRLAVAADLSRRGELELARISGLQDAVGGAAATEAALTGAWTAINTDIGAIAPSVGSGAQGARAAPGLRLPAGPPPGANGMASMGILMGLMALAITAPAVVAASNDAKPGPPETRDLGPGTTITGGVDRSTLSMTYDGSQDGVAVKFKAGIVVHPCPDPSGKFDASAAIDVQTSKGVVGSNAKIDLQLSGQVDDDAHLAASTAKQNTQWADFSGGRGQFLDFTSNSSTGTATTWVANRTGGTLTDGFVRIAVLMSAMFVEMVKTKLLEAAEKAWTSGRCVQLNVTPAAGPEGLDPDQVVSVLAEPRSKLDGAATGGNVTAHLAGGGKAVEPDGSKVPADANFNYTAPGDKDQSGTVSFEARSKRGVGKAEITFKTGGSAAYHVVGGLQDWQVNQLVCDITKPFTLVGKALWKGDEDYSGGLSGTTSMHGIFDAVYSGTYQIVLADGMGSPGTMTTTSSGTTLGHQASATVSYVLTPAEPCTS